MTVHVSHAFLIFILLNGNVRYTERNSISNINYTSEERQKMAITGDVVLYTTLVKYYDNQFMQFTQNN